VLPRMRCWKSGRGSDSQGRFADPQDKRALPNTQFRRLAASAPTPMRLCLSNNGEAGRRCPILDGKPSGAHLVLAVFARGMLCAISNTIRDLFRRTRRGQLSRPVLGIGGRPIAARTDRPIRDAANVVASTADLHLQGGEERGSSNV